MELKNLMKKNLKDRSDEIEDLVENVKMGDQGAFSDLYDIFVDPLYRYFYFRVNERDAEDLLELVFLKVWENIKKYKVSKKQLFSAWVFRIAHNLLVDYYRSVKGVDVAELHEAVPAYKREHNPINGAEDYFRSKILKKALANIKKKYQDVIVYKFINDLSNKEIAQILRKSEGSMRVLQFRALKALRQELENLGIEGDFL